MSVEFMPIDVRVLSHPKMVRALAAGGGDALWTWLALLSWTHEHDGEELPRDCLGIIGGAASGPKRAKLMKLLVDVGLVDESESGYRPHDFDLWEAGAGSHARRRYERDRKKQQRTKGTSRTSPDDVPDKSGTCPGLSHGTCPPVVPSRARVRAGDQTRLDQIRSEDPPVVPPAELSETRQPPQPPPSVVPGKVPCPAGLRLTDDQRATLEVAGIPPWAVDAITVEVVAGYQGDPDDQRPVTAWRKCLSRAISGRWNDPRIRAELRATRQGAGASVGDADPPVQYWRPPPGEGEGAVPCPPEIAERLRRAGYAGPLAPTGSGEA